MPKIELALRQTYEKHVMQYETARSVSEHTFCGPLGGALEASAI